ncbi:hypothetical protein V1264_020096 [Littorina saxatilis]|uniref:protein-tyrosine-phosphatase n=2 Tax=Littorina saxatilis TaxID=31220 RepID=A0AAN9GCE4_9CAEN
MADMWWMIWQEQVSHVVMLTNTMEADRKKCEEYWPSLGEHKQYGFIDVTSLDVQERADYVIRTFQIQDKNSGDTRQVTQYHYVTWPDHDVPLVTPLVDFWCSVSSAYRAEQPSAPLLVHCSAGVGRTGAFVALDSLIQQAQYSKQVNVLHAATRLRHDRCNMIQTKGQYRLVYEAVLEAYTCRHCRVPMASLDAVLTSHVDPNKDNDYIDTEFKKLQQMKVLLSKPNHTEAEKEENINKNTDVTVLPDDTHLVYLTYHVRGRNQYINAVYAPTFFRRKGCILTQLPLRDTFVDFWRLIVGNDVTTVFSLGSEISQSDTDEVYWPRHKGQAMTYGPFNVTLHAHNCLGPHLTSYKLSVVAEGASKASELYLHRYSGWAKELPADVTDFTQLLCLLTQSDSNDASSAPVVLQCRDGASRCGIVRALADVINRMTSDGQVDVYTAVKHVQNVRPQSVLSVKQYRFVYHVIHRYAENSNILYQNT